MAGKTGRAAARATSEPSASARAAADTTPDAPGAADKEAPAQADAGANRESTELVAERLFEFFGPGVSGDLLMVFNGTFAALFVVLLLMSLTLDLEWTVMAGFGAIAVGLFVSMHLFIAAYAESPDEAKAKAD